MCAPAALAIASLAIGAAGDVAGYAAQNKAADANQRAAANALQSAITQTNEREVQETIATNQQTMLDQRRGLAAQAMARTSAAEAGVEGNSVDAIVQTIQQKQGEAQAQSGQNLAMEKEQLQQQKLGELAQYQQRVAAVPGGNAFSLGLGLAGDALSAYTGYRKTQPVMPNASTTNPAAIAAAFSTLGMGSY